MFIAYRIAREICPKYVVVQLRIDCECVVSTWNGGRMIANEWYGEGGHGLFLNYYRSILQRGTDPYLDICLFVIRTWALSNFILGSPICYTVQFGLKLPLFLRYNSGNMSKALGIIMDSVVGGWANDNCRGAMGNSVTFRPNTATDRSPLKQLPGHAQIRHGQIGWQSYG
jgi:hypothetical protein